MKIKEVNAATGEEIVRDATGEEIEQSKLDALESKRIADLIAEREAAKAALLEKLGITEEEAKLLLS